jgi:hypothetical protein
MSGDASIIFIPEQELERETSYTLIVSKDARDLSGLALGEDFRTVFTLDLPYLELLFISAAFHAPFTGADLENGSCLRIRPGEPYVLRLSLGFSLSLSNQAMVNTASRISLTPFFPSSLPALALRAACAESSDILTLEWEGVETGGPGEAHYYRLSIPGGRGGAGDGVYAYFKENRYLYIEALP